MSSINVRTILLFAALTSSCAEQASLDIPNLMSGTCISDLDCTEGKVCIASTCQTAAKPDVELYYAVEPGERTGYVATHFFPEDLALMGDELSFQLPEPTRFNYKVLSAAGDRISASISVYGNRRIPGANLVHTETYLSNRPAQLSLVPDSYRVRFEPKDGTAPGVDTEFTVRMSTQDKEFVLSDRYRTISGLVHKNGDVNSPLTGIQVRAFSLSGRLPSSTALSDDQGRYSIVLPDTSDTSFLVTAEMPDRDLPAWTYEQDVRVELDEDRILNIEFPDTEVERQGEVQIRIVGTRDSVEEPIAEAKVILTATTATNNQRYRLEANTDKDGNVVIVERTATKPVLSLLATAYALEIIPSRGSEFGRKVYELDLSGLNPNSPLTKTITLSRRVRVSGALLSYDASVIADANIDISYQGNNAVFPSPGANITTDEFGNFTAWLDPGRYLVQASPPSSMNLSAQLPPAFIIASVPQKAEFELKPIIISRGARMTGSVWGHDQSVVNSAEITPFLALEDLVIPLSPVSTNEEGRFTLVLPSE